MAYYFIKYQIFLFNPVFFFLKILLVHELPSAYRCIYNTTLAFKAQGKMRERCQNNLSARVQEIFWKILSLRVDREATLGYHSSMVV